MSSRKELIRDIIITSKITITQPILDVLDKSFISIGKDILFITKDGRHYNVNSVSDSLDIINGYLEKDFGFDNISIKTLTRLVNIIAPIMNYDRFEERRDILATAPRWERDDELLKITLVHNGLAKKEVESFKQDDINFFMSDYKKHFPQLDEVITDIVVRKITTSKSNFLNINAPSNWGKSFFIASLNKSSLGLEIQDHKSFIDSTASSSVSSVALVNSLCLCFDEFEYFTDKMKNITFHVQIAEKYKMEKQIELGSKILFNANLSASFVGGVDEQILNRVNLLTIDKKCMPLNHREAFKKFGDKKCMGMLSSYIHTFATSLICKLKSVDDKVSYSIAIINKFDDKYSLKNNAHSTNILDEIQEELLEACQLNLFSSEFDITEVEDGYFVKRAKKTYKALMMQHLEESDVKYRMSLFNAFTLSEKHCANYMTKPIKIDKKNNKGILVKFTHKFVQDWLPKR